MMNNIKPIRYGIMVKGNKLPIWQHHILKHLDEIKGVKLSFIIYDEDNGGLKSQIKDFFSLNKALWFFYLFIVTLFSKANKSIDLTASFKSVKSIKSKTTKIGKFSEYFSDEDIQVIKDQKLDFILRFGFNIIRGDIHKVALHGIWSFHHGDEEKYRGGPPCFWEILNKEKVTGSILQKLNDKLDAGIVLKKGYFKTLPNYIQNRDQAYFHSSTWPALVVKELIENPELLTELKPSSTQAKIYLAPKNKIFIQYILQSSWQRIQNLLKAIFFIDVWNIGIWEKPIESILTQDIKDVNWFPLNKRSFYADPFGYDLDDKLQIFYEKFSFLEKRGVLETTEYKKSNKTWKKNTDLIIKEKFHLSYPFILEDKGNRYIIPESFEDNNINLYKEDEFPLKWSKKKCLIPNLKGIDNTILKHNDKYWIFSTDKDNQPRQNLNIYFSDSLEGTWKSHPLNPVKTDIKSARSAGTIFESNNVLYRPSMDYSLKIEGSVTLNKIITLSETQYKECFVKAIEPLKKESKYKDKIHTISKVGKYTLIDGCKEQFIFKHPLYFIHQVKLIFNFLKK